MPWGPLIFSVLFGVIYANRILDKSFHRLSAPYAVDVKNSDAQRVALLEGIANENSIYRNIKENDGIESDQRKPSRLCQKPNSLQRYFGFNDCSVSEANKLSGKFDESANVKYGSSRDHSDALSSLYESSDFDRKTKNGNPKNFDSYTSSDMDTPKDVELAHSSLLDISSYSYGDDDNYEELLDETKNVDSKRTADGGAIGCDCKVKNDLLDLGQRHFPRYLLSAVCQEEDSLQSKCWRGICKPLEYKVKVLTFRTVRDLALTDPTMAWLPDDLRQLWKFKTVTVAAGCFCV